jgi:hypothetical protein
MARKKTVAAPIEVPTNKLSTQRRFVLIRKVDHSGVSGIGPIAEGVQFSSGEAVLHWLTQLSSVAVYNCIDTLLKVHGHSGDTELVWIDIDEVERPQ